MTDNLIQQLISRLVNVFNKLEIEYVFVGGVAVIAFGRTRTTSDIDVIIDHRGLNFQKFVQFLQENEFDASLTDMKNFADKMHVNFFDKNTMFRIDMKGVYSLKDQESINEALIIDLEGIEIKLDSIENLIVNKLIFGSQIDLEDAIATLTKNYDQIDFELLQRKAKRLNISNELNELMDLYDSNSSH